MHDRFFLGRKRERWREREGERDLFNFLLCLYIKKKKKERKIHHILRILFHSRIVGSFLRINYFFSPL